MSKMCDPKVVDAGFACMPFLAAASAILGRGRLARDAFAERSATADVCARNCPAHGSSRTRASPARGAFGLIKDEEGMDDETCS